MKLAVVIFNLGGPDSPEAVKLFLQNLFSDPAILSLPRILRIPLGRILASRRTPTARAIYEKIGGKSPILEETERQSRSLEEGLKNKGLNARVFIAMRYWKPFSAEVARAVKDWLPTHVVLLPLYPQFSTTTTASSFLEWETAAKAIDLRIRTSWICCYPKSSGFIAAAAAKIKLALDRRKPDVDYRLLLSAHGLPKRVVSRGDPYQWQVEKSAAAIVEKLGISVDWRVCYQSRVGPLEWIGPATDGEIRAAGADSKGVIVAPIAFVSEHSETLVELDLEYRDLAKESGVPDFIRVETVGADEDYIESLVNLVSEALDGFHTVNGCGKRICPENFTRCAYKLENPC